MNKFLRYLLLLLFTCIFVFPIIWVLLSSFKPQSELFTYPLTIFPRHPTASNYVTAFNSGDFPRFFANSIFVSTLATVITVVINVMAGYALSKYYFRGRNVIFYAMIATLMIPLQAIMVPIFLLLKSMGLLNSLWGIIIPPAATPTGVFLARQYIHTIPNSFIEAARIDGTGEFTIFRRIIVPLAKPIVATIAIFSFMWRWNDFLWPFIVISMRKRMTLQLALANFVGQFQINWANLLAMTVVTMIPMIVVFIALQRYFVTGLTAGGIKA
ncbi:MAG TPA: carbohydrate ABC transporter permease [Rectinemataceae bacterium]|nr:carbohydrate ABC transporter permease [Rectinemataceae bacterium]